MNCPRSTFRLPVFLLGALQASGIATGCGPTCPSPPGAELPAERILDWSVSQGLWGSASLTLDRDGTLSYRFQSAKPDTPAESGTARLEHAEVDEIVATLEKHAACGICQLRPGIPDEAIPVLQVRAGGLDCRVDAWDGEWRERAPAIEKLMNDLVTRTGPKPETQPEPAAAATPPAPAPDAGVAADPADAGALSENERHELLLKAEKLLKHRHKIGQQLNAAKCLDGTLRESGNCPKGPPRAVVVANRKAWKELLVELGDDPEVPDLKRRWRATTIEGHYKPKYQ